MNEEMIMYPQSDNLFQDSAQIIESARSVAYQAVDRVLILRNWMLGKRLSSEKMSGSREERYGEKTITELAGQLTEKYGSGFDRRSLYWYVKFYQLYPEIVYSVSPQSPEQEPKKIVDSVSPQSSEMLMELAAKKRLLSWTHYRVLIQVEDDNARAWYEAEALDQAWSVRTLQRNISTQYYERLLSSREKKPVEDEMKRLTASLEEKAAFVKNPYMLEFLGLPEAPSNTESVLESAIITNLQRFIMELGKGYAFVSRQQRIHTDKQDYYIDLVFFNYLLNCFVLIDLKIGRITHQDVGQMDMYVRMYDELKKKPEHNPTLGIVLCSDTDEDIARYSVLHGNEQLFASKYKLLLPSEDQLRAEIAAQKEIFYLQHPELKE